MKFQFPRHLFTPLLIYDAVNEATPSPPAPPPAPDIEKSIEIVPVVEYFQQIFQRSIATNEQNSISFNTFSIRVTDGGNLDIEGAVRSLQRVNVSLSSTISITDTQIQQMQLDIPRLFANVMVKGGYQDTADLRARVNVAVSDFITQKNIQNIYQSTVNFNKFELVIRGQMTLTEDLVSDQQITARIIAVNIINAIVRQLGSVGITGDESQTPSKKLNVPALIAAILSSLCSVVLFFVLIVTLFNGGSSKRG